MPANKMSSFWETLDLLVDRDCRKKTYRETIDEVDEWVESVVKSRSTATENVRKKTIKSSFSSDLTSPDSLNRIKVENAAGLGSASSGYSSWISEVPSECGPQCDVVYEASSGYYEDDEGSVSDSLSVHGPKFVNLQYK